MAVIIVSSTTDPASTTIKTCLLNNGSWNEIDTFDSTVVYKHSFLQDVYLITIHDSKIRHEHIDREIKKKLGIKPKQIIFISRHRSTAGQPSLTVHPIGNYGKAEFGGSDNTLVPCSPQMMTYLLRLINNNLQQTTLQYQVCFEVTHHGPFVETPTLFVEVGSTEKQWNDSKPAEIIAQSVLSMLKQYRYEEDFSTPIPILVGVGGGHYAPRFTDVIFKKNAAFGHMIPKYQIDAGTIDLNSFKNALQATPKASGIYIHKKSFKKSEVTRYKKLFKTQGISVFSSKDLPDRS